MILIACVDDRMGMAFNHRRQSRDRVLRDRLLQRTEGHPLWMSPDTATLFSDVLERVRVSETFLEDAGLGEYCLTEQHLVQPVADRIEGVILYRWNRCYPGDRFFDLDLHSYTKVCESEFAGSSHAKITEEIYIK